MSRRVSIAWSIAAHPRGDRLRLIWREEGGPTVVAPERRGFGSRLIERGLSGELRGAATMTWRPEGLMCAMRAQLPPIPPPAA